jgi:hypothetical protein
MVIQALLLQRRRQHHSAQTTTYDENLHATGVYATRRAKLSHSPGGDLPCPQRRLV